jgi:hypothetical protein
MRDGVEDRGRRARGASSAVLRWRRGGALGRGRVFALGQRLAAVLRLGQSGQQLGGRGVTGGGRDGDARRNGRRAVRGRAADAETLTFTPAFWLEGRANLAVSATRAWVSRLPASRTSLPVTG